MTLKRLWYAVTIILILGVVFYLGYLFGYRETVNGAPDTISVTGPNLAVKNSLSEIEVKNIIGAIGTPEGSNFGQLYYRQTEISTEILLRFQNVPLKVTQAQNKQEKLIPPVLLIQLAQRSTDGLDFVYTTIGKVSFDQPTAGNVRGAQFSTTINFALYKEEYKVERIAFYPERAEDSNLYIDTDKNLPLNVRNGPAPYFWVVL
jgi:hypothetical protein